MYINHYGKHVCPNMFARSIIIDTVGVPVKSLVKKLLRLKKKLFGGG
jgi:hypothetical protein